MRKPRDIDAELKALADKTRSLKAKQRTQLGELVAATGADVLDPETLAGILLQGVREAKIAPTREAWRRDGAAFFHRGKRSRPVTPENLAAALENAGSGAATNNGGDAAGASAGGANGQPGLGRATS